MRELALVAVFAIANDGNVLALSLRGGAVAQGRFVGSSAPAVPAASATMLASFAALALLACLTSFELADAEQSLSSGTLLLASLPLFCGSSARLTDPSWRGGTGAETGVQLSLGGRQA